MHRFGLTVTNLKYFITDHVHIYKRAEDDKSVDVQTLKQSLENSAVQLDAHHCCLLISSVCTCLVVTTTKNL